MYFYHDRVALATFLFPLCLLRAHFQAYVDITCITVMAVPPQEGPRDKAHCIMSCWSSVHPPVCIDSCQSTGLQLSIVQPSGAAALRLQPCYQTHSEEEGT